MPGGREASLLLGGTLGEQHAHRGEHALPLARQLEAGLGDLLAEQGPQMLRLVPRLLPVRNGPSSAKEGGHKAG